MKRYLGLVASLALLTKPGLATAQFSITTEIGGVPTASDATLLNFDGSLPSVLTLAGAASLVTGTENRYYAAPYFSGTTAAFFGEPSANGPDTSQYIAVEGKGSATFSFSTPQEYFGLLWGSVDEYNALAFYDRQDDLIGTVTGTDIMGEDGDFGDVGREGTYYVNIISSTPFSKVVATSTQNSFELDDVAYTGNVVPVPEPSSGALMAWGLGIVFVALAHTKAPNKRGKK